MLHIEILNIGDELLCGQKINTNAAFIGSKIREAGLYIRGITAVGDNKSEIVNILEQMWNRSSVIIISGGLGPTHDDITTSAIVKLFNTTTVLHQQALEKISAYAEKYSLPVEPLTKQAYVPANSKIIANDQGTAPGFVIERQGKLLVVLPGVPHEMQTMLVDSVIPLLKKHFPGNAVIAPTILHTTGISEPQIYHLLESMNWLPDKAKVSFLPSARGIDIDISFSTSVDHALAHEVIKRIETTLSAYIYSTSNKSLEKIIAELLIQQQKRLSVAESCTGGLLAHRLTNVPGSSQYFNAGLITYNNDSKRNLLGVSTATLHHVGAVSANCAKEMALGVRKSTGSDIGISTTGIAGPTGDTPLKPLGLVYIGYADANSCLSHRFIFQVERSIHKERSVQAAITLLWQKLMASSNE